jgi:transcription elongation factor Elf1
MARARLHLICGNCGCNDEWEWAHYEKETDDGEVMQDEDVAIICNNCGTRHSLNDNAKNQNG